MVGFGLVVETLKGLFLYVVGYLRWSLTMYTFSTTGASLIKITIAGQNKNIPNADDLTKKFKCFKNGFFYLIFISGFRAIFMIPLLLCKKILTLDVGVS